MLVGNYPRLCRSRQNTSHLLNNRLNRIRITHLSLGNTPAYRFMSPRIILITVIMSSPSSMHHHTFISLHFHQSLIRLLLGIATNPRSTTQTIHTYTHTTMGKHFNLCFHSPHLRPFIYHITPFSLHQSNRSHHLSSATSH